MLTSLKITAFTTILIPAVLAATEMPNADIEDAGTDAITGADSGIGRAVALAYAKEGADIAFTYLKKLSIVA